MAIGIPQKGAPVLMCRKIPLLTCRMLDITMAIMWLTLPPLLFQLGEIRLIVI